MTSDAPVRSVLLDVQIQIAARRAALRRGRARPAVRALRPRARLGHDAAHAAVDAGDAGRARVHGRSRRSTSTCPAPTTWRWPRRATSTRCPTATSRSSSCSAAACSTRTDGRLQTVRLSWEKEARVRAAGAGVEGDDGPALQRHGLAAAAQGELRPAVGVQVAQRAGHLGRHARRAAGAADGPGPRHRRRRAVRGLRAVALHALGAEEPAPLDLRRRVPAGARGRAPGRPVRDASRRCRCEATPPLST